MQTGDRKARAALELVESIGNVGLAARASQMERSLRVALDVTKEDWTFWDNATRGMWNPHTVPTQAVAAMAPEWRAALVAGLIYVVATHFGVDDEHRSRIIGPPDPRSPLVVLQRLDAVCSLRDIPDAGALPS